jgi:pimeloyl-ACP methyl ester carboxylesterase
VVIESDVTRPDGSTLHVSDLGGDGRPLIWLHGTPNTGEPPEPLFGAAGQRGLRWVSYDRPSYRSSTPRPGRDVASAAADIAAVADSLGVERFALMGHSGGGPHALATAALLPDRVQAVVCGSGLAPYGADGLDWFAGMAAAGQAELRAARAGRSALEEHLKTAEFDPEQFTPADHEALDGEWGWLARVAGQAFNQGLDGLIDDNVAFAAPWGADPAAVEAPVLFLHGVDDRMVPASHSQWLAERCRSAEVWLRPGEGHVSVLRAAPAALDWLVERIDG